MTGAEVRQIRESLNLTQAQFASLLGVHAITVSRWETNTLTPNPYQMGSLRNSAKQLERKRSQDDIATILVTAGVVTALFLAVETGSR
jgi:transcriptional regulator with XRE-family HTH domain